MDKKISFEENWQAQHWKSIVSAYRNSAFFEYYEVEVGESLLKREENLSAYLLSQIQLISSLLNIDTSISLTDQFLSEGKYENDLRKAFDPSRKHFPNWFIFQPYPQVFEGFQVGLSILDLLFNIGPETKNFLAKSVAKDR